MREAQDGLQRTFSVARIRAVTGRGTRRRVVGVVGGSMTIPYENTTSGERAEGATDITESNDEMVKRIALEVWDEIAKERIKRVARRSRSETMSMHKIPLTEQEERGLYLHHLPIGMPSQLSDCFRLGMAWAEKVKPSSVQESAKAGGIEFAADLDDAKEELAEVFFKSARYERPSTDWILALNAFCDRFIVQDAATIIAQQAETIAKLTKALNEADQRIDAYRKSWNSQDLENRLSAQLTAAQSRIAELEAAQKDARSAIASLTEGGK